MRLKSEGAFCEPQVLAAWVVCACLAVFFVAVSVHGMGLSLADNTVELLHGEAVNRYTFLHYFVWSPLYSLWFRGLARVVPDPLVRYYVSWGFFAAAVALLPMLFRMRGAWVYCAVLTMLPLLLVEPFIGECGATLLMVGLCVVLRRDASIRRALGWAFAVSFVGAFVRPELAYAAVLAAFGAAGVAVWRRRWSGLVVGMVLLAGLLLVLQGHSRGKRSGMAVAQHFNLRAAERGELPRVGEFWNSDYAARAFGVDPAAVRTDVATIGDFVRGNPRLYLRFVWGNLLQVRMLVLLVFWLGLLGWPWVDARQERLRRASLYLLVVTAPSLAGMLLVGPRWHYMVMVIPSLLLYGLQMVRLPRLTVSGAAAVVLCGLAAIWMAEARMVPAMNPRAVEERRDLLRVRCERAVDGAADGLAFDATGVGDAYLRRHRVVEGVAALPDWGQFEAWVRGARPVWIAGDASLPARYGVTVEGFEGFLAGEGYAVRPCADGAAMRVYVRGGR